MSNEKMQRAMEFIVEQQAQFAAHMQRVEEERIRDKPRLVRLEESFQVLVSLAQTTDARLDRLELSTDKLESRTGRLESSTSALETSTAALAAAQAFADERLAALIAIREGHNGKS